MIIVTAEKREENLQEAPVAAVVLTDAMLLRDSVDNIDDLEFNTPSLTIATAGQSNQMNMRGIGKFDSGGTSTSAVATYRDGVGTVSGFFNQEPYYDISTVEVLRGPQGTYVGENAAGGAIFVNTKDPVIGAGYDGYVQGGYGDYNKQDLQGAVNIPLGDTAAMRLAGSHTSRHSFYDVFMDPAGQIRNPARPGDIDYDSVRASFAMRPMEQLELLFKFDYNKLDHGGHVYGNVPGFPTPVGALTGRRYGNLTGDLYTVGNNYVGVLAKDRMSRGIFKLNYNFDNGGAIHWVSGIQDIKTHVRNDDDGSVDADIRQDILPKFHVYTSEATYLSAGRSIHPLAPRRVLSPREPEVPERRRFHDLHRRPESDAGVGAVDPVGYAAHDGSGLWTDRIRPDANARTPTRRPRAVLPIEPECVAVAGRRAIPAAERQLRRMDRQLQGGAQLASDGRRLLLRLRRDR